MVFIDVEQNTEEWLSIRSGIPTASAFGRIQTGKGKKSDQWESYQNDIVRSITGIEKSFGGNAATERGHRLEDEAANWYAVMEDSTLDPGGFVSSECGRWGGSPDRLIGRIGGLEIKCCQEGEHSRMLKTPLLLPTKHKPQVYGLLWLTGRKWWDFIAYHPDHESMIVRTKRSCPEYLTWSSAFAPRMKEFCDGLDKLKKELMG